MGDWVSAALEMPKITEPRNDRVTIATDRLNETLLSLSVIATTSLLGSVTERQSPLDHVTASVPIWCLV